MVGSHAISKNNVLINCEGIYHFPFGIPGFGELTSWHLQKTDKPHFFSLTSVKNQKLSFVLLDPVLICPDYDPALDHSDYSILQLSCATDPRCAILCIVTIPENMKEVGITINLRAPLVFNHLDKCAAQCLSLDERWSIRQNLAPAQGKEKTYVDTL